VGIVGRNCDPHCFRQHATQAPYSNVDPHTIRRSIHDRDAPLRVCLVRPRCALPQLAVWDFWRNFARARGNFLGKLLSKVAAAAHAATLDSYFLRKIPSEKFRTEINTPRACDNVRPGWGSWHFFKRLKHFFVYLAARRAVPCAAIGRVLASCRRIMTRRSYVTGISLAGMRTRAPSKPACSSIP
jgi:uncharacterized membrane protein